MTSTYIPPPTQYVLASGDDPGDGMVAAVLADKATKSMPEYGTRTLVINDIICLVERNQWRKRVTTLPDRAFVCVPGRKSDLAQGIATTSVTPTPRPLSPEAVGIITNLATVDTPLTFAERAGASVSAGQLRTAVKYAQDHNVTPPTDAAASASSPIVAVRPGAYDSMTHPGDLSWQSADGSVILTWWAGGRYALGAQLNANGDTLLLRGPTSDNLDVRATSPLGTVLDGTTPYASADGSSAVSHYAHGRAEPAYMKYGVWQNGKLLRWNAPGLAHARYGDLLYTLHADVVDNGAAIAVRPYVRVTNIVTELVTNVITLLMPDTPGESYGVYSAGSFVEGLFLLQRVTGEAYQFYGFFDATVPALRLYGVMNKLSTSSTDENGFYEADLAGDLLYEARLVQTLPGSTRTLTRTITTTAPPATQPLTYNVVTFGTRQDDPALCSAWFDSDFPEWRVDYYPMILVQGETFVRTPTATTSTFTVYDRVDDELMPIVASATEYGRAVSRAKTTYRLTTETYNEVGTKRSAYYVQSSLYPGTDVYTNGAVQTSSTLPVGKVTLVTTDTTVISGVNLTNVVTTRQQFTIPALINHGATSIDASLRYGMGLCGWDAPYPANMPTGYSSYLGNYFWYESFYYSKTRVTANSGDPKLGYLSLLPDLIKTAYQIGDNYYYPGGPTSPSLDLTCITSGFSEVTNYGVTPYTRTDISRTRFYYESSQTARLESIDISFGAMEPRRFTDVYVGSQKNTWWTESDGSTVTQNTDNRTTFTVTPVNDIIGYGDPRWPIANQYSVLPWECYDSAGGVWHPGTATFTQTAGNTGVGTTSQSYTELVFDPTKSLVSEFLTRALDAVVTPYSYTNTQPTRSDTPTLAIYNAKFYEATDLRYGVDGYPGVPTSRRYQLGTYPLQAPQYRGLEYAYKYDISPDGTVLFGLPKNDPKDPNYRPMVWYKNTETGATGCVRVAVDGLYDDSVVYNSPIFVKKL